MRRPRLRLIVRTPHHPRADDVRGTLTAALADPDPGARHMAAVALGMLEPYSKTFLPALIEATGDADPMVRIWALIGLGSALDASVRLASAHALGLIGTAARDALPALAAREADPDERVRRSAKAASYAIRGEAAGS